MISNDLLNSICVNVVVKTFKSVNDIPERDITEKIQFDNIQHPLDDIMRRFVRGLLRLAGRLAGCILLRTGLGVVGAHNPYVRLVGPLVVNLQVFIARNEVFQLCKP